MRKIASRIGHGQSIFSVRIPSPSSAVTTTSTAPTTILFWFYDTFLPVPPHPCIGNPVFLILPAIVVLDLLMPLGIWLTRRSLGGSGQLPGVFPAVDLHLLVVWRALDWVVLATGVDLLIIGTVPYLDVVEYLDSTNFCATTSIGPSEHT